MRRWWPALAVVAALAACEREKREPPLPPEVGRAAQVPAPTIHPGGAPPAGVTDEREAIAAKDVGGRAYDLNEGKRLYAWFNCVGCHAHGGGGIGPPLMDGEWIYGVEPRQIFESIVQGRPNGMPAYGGKIPEHQVWQLVAYVRSLSGLAPKDAATVRDDHMSAKPAESLTPAEKPVPKPAGAR